MADSAIPNWAADLLATWFDRLEPSDWFRSSVEVDAMLERRFAPVLAEQSARPASDFLDHPDTARAAILLFDQIPRNIFRDSADAYAHDSKARAITCGFVDRGWLAGLTEEQAQFVLMPLMHSETLADQDRSVALFAKHAPDALEYARSHRGAIARFGRFPHRNDVLGRETTGEEAEALENGLGW